MLFLRVFLFSLFKKPLISRQQVQLFLFAGATMRIHYMDSLRGILMAVGILLHGANIYHLDGTWLISDSSQSNIFNMISNGIHIFRLPAFFIISGYFSLYVYNKYGWKRFLSRRLPQLCIPLLVTGLVINSLQGFLIYHSEAKTITGFRDYFTTGAWVSHLWFLVYLIFYVSLFGVLMPVKERLFVSTTEWLASPIRKHKWLVYLLFPLVFIVIKAVGSLFPTIFHAHFGGLWIADIFFYAAYFTFGILLLRHENMITALVWKYNAAAAVFFLLGMVAINQLNLDGPLFKVGRIYFYHLLALVVTFFVWQIFNRFLNREIKPLQLLSKACYTIYLFHHVIVILLGILLLNVELPAAVKFLIVATVTLVLTYGIHSFIIERYSILKLLFNGKTDG